MQQNRTEYPKLMEQFEKEQHALLEQQKKKEGV